MLTGLSLLIGTLPADNGGVPAFSVGDLFAGGTVICTNTTGGNYTMPIAPEVEGAAMIVFALQPADLFTQHMASASASLDAFLQSDAVGSRAVGATSYLFLAYGANDAEAAATTAAFRSRLAARVKSTGLSLDVLARMHFSAQRVEMIAGIGELLKQWTTPITSIRVELNGGRTMNLSRLDGKYEVPDSGEDPYGTLLAGNVDGPSRSLAGVQLAVGESGATTSRRRWQWVQTS